MQKMGSKCNPKVTKAYICLVGLLGVGVVCANSPAWDRLGDQWMALVILIVAGSIAQLFPVVSPKNQAYYVTQVFMFAGVLMLEPAPLAVFMVAIFLPAWVRFKPRWYVHAFNIANYLLDAFLAHSVYVLIKNSIQIGSLLGHEVVAALGAVAVFTLVNHVVLAFVLGLANGHSWKETGLFERESLFTDAAMAITGLIAALLWRLNPFLIVLVAAPVYLFYRALNTPNLRKQALTDAKTGLFNARHFWQVLGEEIQRARRFDRSLAVIMADMDLLRNINNTYGHLAGDVVLKGVADIISGELREYDLAARFGGEEFVIILPETDADGALQVAERMRSKVESFSFEVTTAVEPIRATLSLGVATFPVHGWESQDIIHQADLAVYYAKLRGRNQVWVCSPESRALGSNTAGRSPEASYEPSQYFPSNIARAPIEAASVESGVPKDASHCQELPEMPTEVQKAS